MLSANVATDYTSLWGGEPEVLASEQLVTWCRGWRPGRLNRAETSFRLG